MKKLICMVILVSMAVFSAAPICAAAEAAHSGTQGVITPQFTYISLLIPGLSINSSGKATCQGFASAYDSTHTTRLTVELQKYSAGGWSTIKSWYASATGISIASIEENYYVAHGTYRVCATARIYNAIGTLLESKYLYADTAIY